MDLNFSAAELAFRDEVRDFLRDEYPADIRLKMDKEQQLCKDDMVRWQKALYNRGWAGSNWPSEYGGTGWNASQRYILQNECALANTPRVVPFGLGMVGPVIYTFGNDRQKSRFLPDILASNVWWCQGYSEPGSGSDLASLQTKAVRDGGDYLVSGTKTLDDARPVRGLDFLPGAHSQRGSQAGWHQLSADRYGVRRRDG